MISLPGVARQVSVVAALCGVMLSGCAHKTTSNGTTTTTANKKNVTPTDKPVAPPAEEEAFVRVKEKMFPPVDVGSWVCEPKSWNEKEQALLHCTAPAGTHGLIEALKADPAIAEAEAAK